MGVGDAIGRLRAEAAVNGAFWFFAALFGVQTVHMIEHAAQVHQHFMGVAEPRGFFGAWFDFVWVHFVFNVGIFLAIVVIWRWWSSGGAGWQDGPRGRTWFLALVIFQGYHAGEHVLQMIQYYALGADPPTGLIGMVVPNVIAHFDLNLILMVLLAAVAITLRPRHMPLVVVATAADP